MPCISFIDRRTNEVATFGEIDAAMRQHFNRPLDSDHPYCGWIEWITQPLAHNMTMSYIRTLAQDTEWDNHEGPIVIAIIDWLDEHYKPLVSHEYGRGGRG